MSRKGFSPLVSQQTREHGRGQHAEETAIILATLWWRLEEPVCCCTSRVTGIIEVKGVQITGFNSVRCVFLFHFHTAVNTIP